MNGGLLVAHVDNLDAFVEAAVVDAHDVSTRQREHVLHPGGGQRLRRQLPSVHS